MSKSKGNYVGLAFEPKEMFGRLMSAADRLLPAYLRALTELLDPEIDLLLRLMADRKVHPMGVKILLASDVTSTVHGLDAAAASRAGFTARFSRKHFSGTPDLPVIGQAEHGGSTVGELFVRVARTVPSMSQVRRVASGGGLRLVTETPGKEQETIAADRGRCQRHPGQPAQRAQRARAAARRPHLSEVRALPDRDQLTAGPRRPSTSWGTCHGLSSLSGYGSTSPGAFW